MINGLHHVTAIAGDAQRNIDYYTGVLGLRLVKVTVNYDDPGGYHFYYGDEQASIGTLVTHFPIVGGRHGQPGAGQAIEMAYAVPDLSRYAHLGETTERFGQKVIAFQDPDGIGLAFVEAPGDLRLHSVTLLEREIEPTESLLIGEMGVTFEAEEGGRRRYRTGDCYVDLLIDPGAWPGRMGVGVIHHTAFRTENEATQLEHRSRLQALGANVSPVRDRQYFRSIYFFEPGGALFEIATEGPGIGIDETVEELGSSLKLPPMYEDQRAQIEAKLPKIRVPRRD